jgi:hypothetical protein
MGLSPRKRDFSREVRSFRGIAAMAPRSAYFTCRLFCRLDTAFLTHKSGLSFCDLEPLYELSESDLVILVGTGPQYWRDMMSWVFSSPRVSRFTAYPWGARVSGSPTRPSGVIVPHTITTQVAVQSFLHAARRRTHTELTHTMQQRHSAPCEPHGPFLFLFLSLF